MPSKKHQFIQDYLQRKFLRKGMITHTEVQINNRRADLLVLPKKLVIEIQLSPISFKKFMMRNLDYHFAGVNILWVFAGENHYKKNKKFNYMLNLNAIQQELKFFYYWSNNKIKIITPKWRKFKKGRVQEPTKTIWTVNERTINFDCLIPFNMNQLRHKINIQTLDVIYDNYM